MFQALGKPNLPRARPSISNVMAFERSAVQRAAPGRFPVGTPPRVSCGLSTDLPFQPARAGLNSVNKMSFDGPCRPALPCLPVATLIPTLQLRLLDRVLEREPESRRGGHRHLSAIEADPLTTTRRKLQDTAETSNVDNTSTVSLPLFTVLQETCATSLPQL